MKNTPTNEDNLSKLVFQKIEWEAWQEVVKELKRLGIDINKQDSLNKKLLGWAIRRHVLFRFLGE